MKAYQIKGFKIHLKKWRESLLECLKDKQGAGEDVDELRPNQNQHCENLKTQISTIEEIERIFGSIEEIE